MYHEARARVQTIGQSLSWNSIQGKSRFLVFILLGFNLLAFFLHFFGMKKLAMNIPLSDEWEFVNQNLASGFSYSWVFTPHNEHRIIFSKLLTVLLYRLNGWDLVQNQLMNFFIYGLICCEILFLAWKTSTRLSQFCVVAAISPIVFSPLSYENHGVAFNISTHLFILFFIPACTLLLSEKINGFKAALGGILCLFSVLSFSGGVFCVLALTGTTMGLSRFRKRPQNWIAIFPSLIMIAAWLLFFRHPNGHPEVMFPWRSSFWKVFFGLFSGGLGIRVKESWIGFIYFTLASLPLLLLAFSRRFHFPQVDQQNLEETYGVRNGFWMIQTVILGLILTVAAGSAARAGFGPGTMHTSRYAEYILILTPFVAMSLIHLPMKMKRLKSIAVIAICGFTGICFSHSLSLQGYRKLYQAKIQGRDCICEFFKQGGSALCSSVYPGDLSWHLSIAKKLDFSFIRSLQCFNQNKGSSPTHF